MFNLGFQGQFGGGFVQAPGGDINQPTGGAGVTYSLVAPRMQPRDRSGRKPPYIFSSEGQSGVERRRRSH